ncbi:MAG: hypothetical protein CM15mP119_1980 [Alphaproteobacteria bacterium]|nr:MAG: hypothetical protein CM15mP119_1980 [Alphaproteobacteria bacterium]
MLTGGLANGALDAAGAKKNSLGASTAQSFAAVAMPHNQIL